MKTNGGGHVEREGLEYDRQARIVAAFVPEKDTELRRIGRQELRRRHRREGMRAASTAVGHVHREGPARELDAFDLEPSERPVRRRVRADLDRDRIGGRLDGVCVVLVAAEKEHQAEEGRETPGPTNADAKGHGGTSSFKSPAAGERF